MFRKLIKIAIILGLIVVVLGAYTRLSDAGLGCPDWPTCYGKIVVSNITDTPSLASNIVNWQAKAWKEMIHRYTASLLGLLIVVMTIIAFRATDSQYSKRNKRITLVSLILVITQGILGMLTVTELLNPIIVVLHLLGGMSIVSLLFWLLLKQSKFYYSTNISKTVHRFIIFALVVVSVQIALGGWTSANYAALSCGSYFPTCLGSWLPEAAQFSQAILPAQPLGINYEYGVLENGTRIAIQLLHRSGALVVFITLIVLTFLLKPYPAIRFKLVTLLTLLGIQILLGILNIVLSLPILVAVMHNLVALLLVLSLLNIFHATSKISLADRRF